MLNYFLSLCVLIINQLKKTIREARTFSCRFQSRLLSFLVSGILLEELQLETPLHRLLCMAVAVAARIDEMKRLSVP